MPNSIPKITTTAAAAAGTTTVTGAFPTPFPQMPAPLKDEGLISTEGEIIPHKGTLINQVQIPRAFTTGVTGDIEGRLGTTVVWSVNANDVNAANSGYIGVQCQWYDSVNDRLYVFGVNTGTAPDTIFTAYITLETGAITQVGNVQLSTDLVSLNTTTQVAISRANIDSGDFTFRVAARTLVLSSTTGAEVSNVAQVNQTDNNTMGPYTTLDGLVAVSQISMLTNDTSNIIMSRGGNTAIIPVITPLMSDATSSVVLVMAWGDKVKIFQNGTSGNVKILRTFTRTLFDAWITKLADYGGLA